MSEPVATGVFRPYTDMPTRVPSWVWVIARIVTLAVTFAVLATLIFDPELGITLFWRIFIPSLPLIFALVPGIWRQVCPMAFFNQLPVRMGFSAERTLPMWLKESSYLFAMVAFVIFVALKHVTLYESPLSLLFLAAAALGAAFVGGLIFKGRSGWCGTFCPLGPLQKVYGHAPAMLVKNGYCETGCVGCQKNCYDFSPRSAFFADLSDKDTWYAGHRQMFIGVLPGLILSFWLGRSPSVIGYMAYFQETALWLIASAGSFFILTSILKKSIYKVAAIYGVTALFLYYWFAAPVIVGGLRDVFDMRLPDILAYLLQAVVVVVAARNLYAGLRLEQAYEAQVAAMRDGGMADVGAEQAANSGRAVLIERSKGKTISLVPGKTVLELMEDAGVQIDFGCRNGMCGADPVFIEDGAENLSPPSKTELETLRRLGLEGKARMACVCKARKGPVTINLEADLAAAATVTPATPAEDLAEMAGVNRVVIVGNGVAGVTAADRLRQASPSLEIDVVSRENHHFYNRMAIGRAIYGRTALDGLDLLPNDWAKKNKINVWLNTFVTDIDRENKYIALGTGETLSYDKLLLATGGKPIVLPIPGANMPGSFVLREAHDALEIRAFAQRNRCRHAVVVGGGVLGIEAADALRQLGLDVSLVQRADRLMDLNLDEKSSFVLANHLRDLGMNIVLNSEIAGIEGGERMERAVLKDGRVIDAQICLFCIGVSGETELAVASGLETRRGIVVDNAMKTSDPHIYAIGDAAEFGSGPSGLWTLGAQHAQLATDDILKRREGSSVPHTVMKLKMDNIDVVAYGEPHLKKLGQEEIVDPNEPDTLRRKLVIENGRIVGAFVAGPPGTAKGIADAILEEKNIATLLPELRRGNWDALSAEPDADDAHASEAEIPAVATSETIGQAGSASPLAWAAGILIGVALALSAAWLVGAEPDKMKIDSMMHALDDAMQPKRKSIDATSRFGQADKDEAGASVTSDTAAKTDATGTVEPDAPKTVKRIAGAETESATQPTSESLTSPTPDSATTAKKITEPVPPKVKIGAGTESTGASETVVPAETTTPSLEPDAGTKSDAASVPEVPIEDLRTALSGKTIRGGRDFGGQRFTLRLNANGALQAEVMLDETFGSTGIDNGRWSVTDDQICFRLSYLADGRRICSIVTRGDDGITFAAPGGDARGWRVQ